MAQPHYSQEDRRKLPRITLFLVASFLAVGQPKPSLDDLIDEAVQHNLRLLAERYNLTMADARILQARLRPNPTLQLQWQYTDTFHIGFSADKNPAGPPEIDSGVMYPWVRGGKRHARIDVAMYAKAVAQADFLDKTRTLILDVQTAFLEYLLARETLGVINDTRGKLDQTVEINRARVKAGDLAEVELYRSELAAHQDASQAAVAETRVRNARFKLQAVAGRSSFDPAFDVSGTFRRLESIPTEADLLQTAFERRPDLMSLRRDIERARANVRLQVATGKPDWNVGALFSRQYNIGIQNGNAMTYTAFVPLAVSDKNQGEIARSREELAQLETRVRALEYDIRLDVATAYLLYENALQLMRRYETNLLDRGDSVRSIIEYSVPSRRSQPPGISGCSTSVQRDVQWLSGGEGRAFAHVVPARFRHWNQCSIESFMWARSL